MAAMANGTGRANTKRHPQVSTRTPPKKGPRAAAIPVSPDHAPMADARSSGTKQDSMMARLPGVSSAAPTPCRTRAAINQPTVGAAAQAIDANANHPTPST